MATAEREKSRPETKQSGDVSKAIVNPQKQAAEALRQTAELAKQVTIDAPLCLNVSALPFPSFK